VFVGKVVKKGMLAGQCFEKKPYGLASASASAGAALLYWMRVVSLLVSIHKDLPWESLL